ncbi:MAG: family 10 glycosylhydrolase [Acidobacteriota bacterium]
MNTDKNRFLFTNCHFTVGVKLSVFICVYLLLISPVFAAQTRAVWVRPFINADIATRKDAKKGRAFIQAELQKIKRADLNTVYLESFWDGYTIYPSHVASQRPLRIDYGVAENGKGWDVLKTYIEEGEKLNIKIHAWLHIFHQWNTNLGGLENSPIFSKHKDWSALDAKGSPLVVTEAEGANRDIYKVFMSPSNEEVRKFLREIVGEISVNYPHLGGIQWDYIRYPLQNDESSFDYNPLTVARFRRESGLETNKLSAKNTPKEWKIWQDWKTAQVTETVRELAAIVRRNQPQWEISAAVFPDIEQNLRVKQQDWKTWSAKGYVDALLPMLYSTNFNKVEIWAKDFRRDVAPQTKIYPALFIGHFYDAKTEKLNGDYLQIPSKFQFDGFGLFAAQSLTEDLIEKLAAGKYLKNTEKINRK